MPAFNSNFQDELISVFLCVSVVGSAGFVLLPILAVPLYFVPTVVAMMGGKRGTAGIFILNLLLGWTVIGWIIALIWALSAGSNND